MEKQQRVPIWFFIGILLAIYGILILGSGIFGLFQPPRREVALSYLHADIWWGALLLVIGAIYVVRFNPSKDSHDDNTGHGQ
jgi:hypothetical protein